MHILPSFVADVLEGRNFFFFTGLSPVQNSTSWPQQIHNYIYKNYNISESLAGDSLQ